MIANCDNLDSQKMLADHREYCKNNSGSVLDPIADILARLEKVMDFLIIVDSSKY